MPDNDTINIDTTPPPQLISIANPSALSPKLSTDAREYRSDNAAFGLTNQTFFTKDDWSEAMRLDQEDTMRAAAAAKVNTDRADMAKQLIDTHPYLPDSTLQTALKYQNPKSVVEEHYAKSWMNALDWPKDSKPDSRDGWAYWTQLGLKEQYDWVKNAGSQIVAKDNYMLSTLQNDDATWSDVLKVAVPDVFTAGVFGEYQLRQNTAGTPWWYGIGVGGQLKEQSERLGQMTEFDPWREEFDRVYQSLPKAYRAGWVKDMIYKSDSSVVADNLLTGVNATFAGKLATNLGRNVLTPAVREAAWARATIGTRYTTDLVNAQSRIQNLVNAVADMTKPRPANVPPSVAAPAQAGNLPESAVNIVKIDAINELYPNNNPLGSLINRLAAIYDADGTLAASDPGRLGREAGNRLREMYDTYKADFTNTVFNEFLQRVDRTPTAELETQLGKIQQGMADLYRGADNMVGNVSRGIWIPGYNSRLFNVAVISNDAELFRSAEEAMANARRNGWAIKGDYNVGPEERIAIFKKESAIKGFRTNAANAKTAEGAARANGIADRLQSELDKIPRHETGVTIESQFRPGQVYSEPIGPTMPPGAHSGTAVPPRKPAGASKPGGATPVAPGGKPSVEPSNRTFTTEKGSTYEVHPDGTTTRNKAKGIHEGDFGPKPRSEKTIYVDSDKAAHLSGAGLEGEGADKGFHVILRNGKASLISWNTKAKGWGVTKEGFEVPFSETPGVGKSPVELWNKNTHPNLGEVYSKQHAGHKIVAESTGAPGTAGIDPTLARFRAMQEGQAEAARKALAERRALRVGEEDILFGDDLMPGETPEQRDALREYLSKPRALFQGENVEDDLLREKAGFRPSRAGTSSSRGKEDLSGINDDEHLLQFRTRKKMQREWEALTPAERAKILSEYEEKPTPDKAAQFYGLPSETIKQQGNGYYILHTVWLPENANFVRDGLITSDYGGMTKEEFRQKLAAGQVSTGLVPPDWSNNLVMGFLNRLGLAAPSEVMSIAENLNRNIATHGPSVLLGMLKKGIGPIKKLSDNPILAKKYWNDFNRLIRFAQNDFDPVNRTPGRWFDTMSDVDDWYQRNIGRQVTELETQAYFAYKALVLGDLNFRNLSVMTRKLAMGARQHAVQYTDSYGQKVTSPFFEGVRLDRIPESGRALFVGSDGDSKFDSILDLLSRKPGLREDLAEGRAQIIQVMDPKSKPLRDIDRRGVDYVLSYSTEEKPLGMDHVNRLGGGHLIPKWDWFLKQADVEVTPLASRTLHVYNGDKTLLSFRSRAEAREASVYLENVRQLLSRAAKLPEDRIPYDIMRWETEGGAARDIPLSEREQLINQAALENRRTGIPFHKLLGMWMDPNAAFNVHEPLVVVPKGRKIIDMGTEGADLMARHRETVKGTLMDTTHEMVDATKDGSLLGQVMAEFTQERDAEGLWTMTKKGTESNPWFAYEPASLIDPITAMERGYKGIVNSMYMYDMKQFSMEHWLQQAKDYLEKADTIRSNPLHHFFNPVYKKGIDPEIQWMLEGNRRNALDFVGLRSRYDTSLTAIGQKFFDFLYGKDKFVMPQLNELPTLTKLTDLMKGFGFYYYITSLKSFWTQAATMSYLYSVAGTEHMQQSLAAMTMYGMYKINPNLLEAMDRQMAAHWNWAPGRFTEAVRMLDGSGFGHIGQEHAFRQGTASLGLQSMDNINSWSLGTRVAYKGGKAVLDMTAIPFELGAATTRLSGFFTSFLEHLGKAPGGVLDRQMQASILNRASLLDVNMSRAHNTRLQNNAFLSIPMQFMSYDIRMAQMMWGKNLTVEEKQRLFAMSSMLYGLRGGGLALFGAPVAGATMKALQNRSPEQGGPYVPGENSLKDIMVNGFPSWMFAMLSGFASSDGKKTWIDLSNWGNRGVDIIEKFFDKDNKSPILLGAAGSAFQAALDNTWGLRRAVIDLGKDDNGYKATDADWYRMFDMLAATRDFHQGWLSLQTGKMLTDKGTVITDQSKFETFLKTFFGIRKINQGDAFAKQKVIEELTEDVRAAQAHINQEILRFAIDGANGDENNARIHWQNANNIMRALVPEDKHKVVMGTALRNIDESLEQRLNEQLNIKFRNDFETYRKLYTGK